ncbi:MAG: hypothetical protein NT007_11045 [Candidatus Kapabacteria bacterium]|nr:hypothetical protein [Candidatus Kapabacteria bacterium]
MIQPSEGFKPSEGSRIDVSALAVRIYILKAGAKVQKFVRM